MCPDCNIIQNLFESAKKDADLNYFPVLSFLQALEKQKRIVLFAGDCLLEDAAEILKSEQHYTVSHYLKCRRCSAIYFSGACIRGTPIFKTIDEIRNENFESLIWGKHGIYYSL